MIPEKIETTRGRLLLRYFTEADTQTVYDIWSNPANARFMDAPESLEDVRELADWNNGAIQHSTNKDIMCHFRVVTLKETGEVIGTCRWHFKKEGKEMGFGYNLAEKVWGRGYATELLETIIALAKKCEVKKLIGGADKENVASWHILGKYMNFVGEENYTESDGRVVVDRNYELNF
ncbi:MAG: GNAT family N-acetyltransferase [Clostridia bacterium]|nr:GNAT family N-acetyltransferase [Clostridia bacterium]